MMKKYLSAALLGLTALGFNAALAHGGATPKHGGVVAVASDLSFELVGTATGAAIYVEDHGKPIAPTGLKGKLTVLNGAEKSEAELVPRKRPLSPHLLSYSVIHASFLAHTHHVIGLTRPLWCVS